MYFVLKCLSFCCHGQVNKEKSKIDMSEAEPVVDESDKDCANDDNFALFDENSVVVESRN